MRKHRVALIALGVYHLVFFFPTLFMGRIPSPNDVFFNFEPWKTVAPHVDVQNSLINDPPTAYYTVLSLIKSDWRALHWNPFIGSGIPGWGSTLLAPFSFLPALLLPLPWVYAGIILLKLNVGFWFTYLWLREERLGRHAAATGAIVLAAAGPIAVRWWWHVTNAAPLYPALLWIALRTARGKRTPSWIVGLVALCYALSAFPATMAYGAYAAAAYLLWSAAACRRFWSRATDGKRRQATALHIGAVALATALGIVIAAPSFIPLAQLVRRTGYLGSRANAAAEHVFPARHLRLFVNSEALGNRATRDWRGDRDLGTLNNYIESTVYVGIAAIALLPFALMNRRARSRWFWLAMLAVMLAAMFGVRPISTLIGNLPGFKFSPLTRVQMMLPIAAAYLAAAGANFLARGRWRVAVATLIAVVAAADLAIFAGRFYPYIEPRLAAPPVTPMIAFLQSEPRPFRVAPFFDYLWPNTAELFRFEDVRSHFSSEASYRQMLERIDPSAALSGSTVINFNSTKFNLADPLVSMLNVRYLLEQQSIDILKWSIFANTKPGVTEIGAMDVKDGQPLERHVRIDAEPFYAVELPIELKARGRIDVTLIKGAAVVYRRAFTSADVEALGKIYVPVRPYARLGKTLTLRVRPLGTEARLLTGSIEAAGDAPIFYGRVMTPIIFDRAFVDGRVFRNLAEVPRFHAVTRLRRGDVLTEKNIDYATEAIVTDKRDIPLETSDAAVTLRSYTDDEQTIDISAPAKTFLASSEKLTPELRVTVDGRRVTPVEINTLFAGIPVPAGNHRVTFTRRLGYRWWPAAGVALLGLIALSIVDARVARGA